MSNEPNQPEQKITFDNKEKSDNKKKSDYKEKSDNKEKSDKEDEKKQLNKKKPNIPNTLTIYIKTRIPNHNNLLYDPSMTVPETKSHTVYFDPLVKYSKWAIKNIPSNAPPDSKYTQFFEANQFDSLINRCINSIFNFQKKLDLNEAIKEGVIDNNINLTIKSLFKKDGFFKGKGLFYINKRPYTILGRSWNKKWDVDTKPNNKLLSPYANLSYKDATNQAEKELEEFKKSYPNATGSANIKNEKIKDELKNGIEFKETIKDKMISNLKIAEEAQYVSDVQADEEAFIIPNFPVLFTNEMDINTDPISFSLLMDKDEFIKFIENSKNESSNLLIKKYGRYIEIKKKLYENINEYDQTRIIINYIQEQYRITVDNIFYILVSDNEIDRQQTLDRNEEYDIIDDNVDLNYTQKGVEKRNFDESQQEYLELFKKNLTMVPNLCEELFDFQVQIMKQIVKLADKLLEIFENQRDYFNSIVDFLKEYKKVYALTIEYPNEKPDLAFDCIDTDIRIYELLSAEILKEKEEEECKKYSDTENCENYFKTINIFKEKVKKIKKDEQLLYSSNIDEITQMYIDNPFLLITSREQLNIYYATISMSYNINQLNIWKIYYNQTEKLVTKMIKYYFKFMEKMITFKEKNPNITYENLIERYPTFSGITPKKDIIKAEVLKWLSKKINSNQKIEWKLVNDDNIPIIPDKTETNKADFKYEEKYIELFKLEGHLYDCIVLITNLLEIKCRRLHSVYIAENNVTNMDLIMLKLYFIYYNSLILYEVYDNDANTYDMFDELIELDNKLENKLFYPDDDRTQYIDLNNYKNNRNLRVKNVMFIVPPSNLLETNKLRFDNIRVEIKKIGDDVFFQSQKKKYIIAVLKNFTEYQKQYEKILHPKISKQGIINKCNELLDGFNDFCDLTQLVTFTYFNEEINTKNIDIDKTIKFNKYVLEINETLLGNTSNDIIDQWFIYKNNYITGTGDYIFLTCIKNILNKELKRLNAITVNFYTDIDRENAVKQFTVESLQRLIEDNNIPYTIQDIIILFKNVLDIHIYTILYDDINRLITIDENIDDPLYENYHNIIFLLRNHDSSSYQIISNYEGRCMFDDSMILFFSLWYQDTYVGPDGDGDYDEETIHSLSLEPEPHENLALEESKIDLPVQFSEGALLPVSPLSEPVEEDIASQSGRLSEASAPLALPVAETEIETEEKDIIKNIIKELETNVTLNNLFRKLNKEENKLTVKRDEEKRIISVPKDQLEQINRTINDINSKIVKNINDIFFKKFKFDLNLDEYFKNTFEQASKIIETYKNIPLNKLEQTIKNIDHLMSIIEQIKKIKKYTDYIQNNIFNFLNSIDDEFIETMLKNLDDIKTKMSDKKNILGRHKNDIGILQKLFDKLEIGETFTAEKIKMDTIRLTGLETYVKENLKKQLIDLDSKLVTKYNGLVDKNVRNGQILGVHERIDGTVIGGGFSNNDSESDSEDSDSDSDEYNMLVGGQRPSREYANYAQQNPYLYNRGLNPYPNPNFNPNFNPNPNPNPNFNPYPNFNTNPNFNPNTNPNFNPYNN